ncbi:xanthine dehydrogenase accessory protein XdhC [Viridibacterium curvum]|uniref:Xanthine dehydrogenase accessory protein XdhC n=1 Tax=Viridibacterium curvum TaxID=1101404 RepID=A0ABP9QNE0_9RHOO
MNWWRALPDVLTHEDAVLVTVARTQGSVPREAGASMLVTLDATVDTIGGGHLEWEAMAQARAMLLQPVALPAMQRLSLGASLGQCCGGVVWLVFERISQAARVEWLARALQLEAGESFRRTLSSCDAGSVWCCADGLERNAESGCQLQLSPSPSGRGHRSQRADTLPFPHPEGEGGSKSRERGDGAKGEARSMSVTSSTWHFTQTIASNTLPITVFGAGHVGAAIARLLATLDTRIRWVDPRDDQFGTPPANVECLSTDAPEEAVASAPAGSFFLVLTHSHALDLTLCEHILRRGDFSWFGLIGSATKRARFEHRLNALGLDCARMQCPIGIAGIADKSPQAIAIAVVAQVLQVKEQLKQGAAHAC